MLVGLIANNTHKMDSVLFQYPDGYQKEKENKDEVEVEAATPSKAKRKRKSQGSGKFCMCAMSLFTCPYMELWVTEVKMFLLDRLPDLTSQDP